MATNIYTGLAGVTMPERITLRTAAEYASRSREALQKAAVRFDRGSVAGLETVSVYNEHGMIRLTTREWVQRYLDHPYGPLFPGTSEERQKRWGSIEVYPVTQPAEGPGIASAFYALCQREAMAGRPWYGYMVVDRDGSGNTEIVDELRAAIDDPTAGVTEFRCHTRGRDDQPEGGPVSIVLGVADTYNQDRIALVRRRGL